MSSLVNLCHVMRPISVSTANAHRVFRMGLMRKFSSDTDQKPSMGVVGLGNMGGGMARNLRQAGFEVTVFDVDDKKANFLKDEGAKVVSSPGEVAAKSNITITSVPSTAQLLDVFKANDGLLKSARPGGLFMDTSTVDASVCGRLRELTTKQGASFMDAPVSGGAPGAANGTLTFMVGSSESDFERALPAMRAMGKTFLRCGEVGSGQATKACNNLLLAICMIGASEALNLGVNLGLDPKNLSEVIKASTGQCYALDNLNPIPGINEKSPSSRDFQRGFKATLMLKDIGLVLNTARETGTSTPLTKEAYGIYNKLVEAGYKDEDFSVVYRLLRTQNKGKL